jgi:hypothetical protein
MKTLVKNGKRIKGFVYQDKNNNYWYAFGKPSQDNYISFACKSIEHGIACIEIPLLNNQ